VVSFVSLFSPFIIRTFVPLPCSGSFFPRNMLFILHLAGIPFLSIWSQTPQSERDTIIRQYNDPNHPSVALLVMDQVAGLGVDIQTCTLRIFHVDIPTSWAAFLQCIGRPVLLGQPRQVYVYLLFLINSYDQILMSSLQRKTLPFLSSLAKGANNDAMEHASDLFRLVLGMQYPMTNAEWSDLDLTKKDSWIKEFEHRVAIGDLRGQPCQHLTSHVLKTPSVKLSPRPLAAHQNLSTSSPNYRSLIVEVYDPLSGPIHGSTPLAQSPFSIINSTQSFLPGIY